MARPTEFFRWWIVDERTGKRRLTRFAMTRDEAARYTLSTSDAAFQLAAVLCDV